MADIQIDEDFIRSAQHLLDILRNEIPAVVGGGNPSNVTDAGNHQGYSLATLTVKAGGDTFFPGQAVTKLLEEIGKALNARFQTHFTDLRGMVLAIDDLLSNTDHIESLNSMSLAEFESYFAGGGATTTAA
jgi:hypothetical protein